MKIVAISISILLLQGCVQWQPLALYEEPLPEQADDGLKGFTSSLIWQEQWTSELWVTQEKKCIELNLENQNAAKGQNFLHLKWNKQAGGCPWLGLGLGWDGWSGKDISMITSSADLTIQLKNFGGKPLKAGLPGALGFEDFSGNQSYVGLFGKYVEGGAIGSDWVTMRIPLADIVSQNPDLDVTAIKQMIITLESEGNIGLDEIVIKNRN